MQTANIPVKISFRNQKRRFSLPELSFSVLESKIADLFHLPQDCTKNVCYLDEENDWITVSSDAELITALEFSQLKNHNSLQLKFGTDDDIGRKLNRVKLSDCNSSRMGFDLKELKREAKEAKMKAKVEKRLSKIEKKTKLGEKRQKDKSEKFELKMLKKQAKEQKKRENEAIKKDDFQLSNEEWPSNIKKVYLDGNNMLFISSTLRTFAIRGPRSNAEKILIGASSAFHQLQTNVTLTHLVFDNSNLSSTGGDDRVFQVSSARPDRASTDDLFAEIAQQQHEMGQHNSCLFVTSDRELRQRIRSHSCACVKPGNFWQYVFNLANSDPEIAQLDQWFAQFLPTNRQE